MSAYQVTDTLYLWWVADPDQPRLVGSLRHVRRSATQPGGVSLTYDQTWLESGQWGRSGQALSEDLPLHAGEFMPVAPDSAVGAVDDARPDRWGERVIRLLDQPARLSTLEFLYFAGDDRFGALGVSTSATAYLPRLHGPSPTLSDVQAIHDLIRQLERGDPVEPGLRRLVTPGVSLGGARPKALLQIDSVPWIVKFAEAGDPIDSPLIEHATMTLAARAGIEVCQTLAIPHARGHAVAVRRFDREGHRRLHALSAHVALRAAGQAFGYPDLALLLRRRGVAADIEAQGEQLFRRMVFNILIDNTDDHEKNHSLLADAANCYRLSPAYDILPSGQALGYQQMRVGRDGAGATLANAMTEHRSFSLTHAGASQLCAEVAGVVAGWREHFQAAGVAARDIELLSRQIDREFLQSQREAPP